MQSIFYRNENILSEEKYSPQRSVGDANPYQYDKWIAVNKMASFRHRAERRIVISESDSSNSSISMKLSIVSLLT